MEVNHIIYARMCIVNFFITRTFTMEIDLEIAEEELLEYKN